MTSIRLQFREEFIDSYSGQSNFKLTASQPGRDDAPLGFVAYSVFRDKPAISLIEVMPNYRRRGVATQLLQSLQEIFPGVEIEWGMLTGEGGALYKALPKSVVPSGFATKFAELDDLRVQRDLFEINAEAFHAIEQPTDAQRDHFLKLISPLNALHDRIFELENELHGESPVKTLLLVERPNNALVPQKEAQMEKQMQYEAAVQAGDMLLAQRLVDDAAREAGVISFAVRERGSSYTKRGIEQARELRDEGGSLASYGPREQAEWLLQKVAPEEGKEITIYRATPDGSPIRPGDYVTNILAYAQDHLERQLDGKGAIVQAQATLDDLFPADGPREMWFAPAWIETRLAPVVRDSHGEIVPLASRFPGAALEPAKGANESIQANPSDRNLVEPSLSR